MVGPVVVADTHNLNAELQRLAEIRVVLGALPEMLRGIIREVLRTEPDIEIVREAHSNEELLAGLATGDADVVVIESLAARLGPAGTLVLRDRPTARVLALSPDGRSAAIYRLQAVRIGVNEVSPGGLREAIRHAVAAPTGG